MRKLYDELQEAFYEPSKRLYDGGKEASFPSKRLVTWHVNDEDHSSGLDLSRFSGVFRGHLLRLDGMGG